MDFEAESEGGQLSFIESSRPELFRSFRPVESRQTGALIGGRYQICGFLTKGSTARVYLAEDLATHDAVVVKMLAPEAQHDVPLRERLVREANTVRSVQHPNIVRVLDNGVTGAGIPYVVMEALVGESLGDYLRRGDLLPLDTGLLLARQAATALFVVHEHGIVHRDVKPDNFLLLGPAGDPYGLKVIDFGMAKQRSAADSGPHMIVGTAEYMAPEQILTEHVDARSDVYSLGIVLFRLITGQLPFEGVERADLLRHQLFSSIPPPSWLSDDIDPRLDTIVLNATRKHPGNRYPSMAALRDDIEIVIGMRQGEVQPLPLLCEPDAYEAKSEKGREAIAVLARKFGQYASSAPPQTMKSPS